MWGGGYLNRWGGFVYVCVIWVFGVQRTHMMMSIQCGFTSAVKSAILVEFCMVQASWSARKKDVADLEAGDHCWVIPIGEERNLVGSSEVPCKKSNEFGWVIRVSYMFPFQQSKRCFRKRRWSRKLFCPCSRYWGQFQSNQNHRQWEQRRSRHRCPWCRWSTVGCWSASRSRRCSWSWRRWRHPPWSTGDILVGRGRLWHPPRFEWQVSPTVELNWRTMWSRLWQSRFRGPWRRGRDVVQWAHHRACQEESCWWLRRLPWLSSTHWCKLPRSEGQCQTQQSQAWSARPVKKDQV